VGPFEEEEEGTGIASDVVKVQGKDPATPVLDLRNDPGLLDSPISGQQNKATHTHTCGTVIHNTYDDDCFYYFQK